jgi:hypothetical protein
MQAQMAAEHHVAAPHTPWPISCEV